MSNSQQNCTDPREIAKWAERYARSRTIPFLVQWVFITTLVVVLGALSQGAIMAWQTGHSGLQWTCILAIAVLTSTLLWFSIARGGRRQVWHISQWVYGAVLRSDDTQDQCVLPLLPHRRLAIAPASIDAPAGTVPFLSSSWLK